MAQDLLADYLEHHVEVSLSSCMQGQRTTEEGILQDCSSSGLILEQDDGILAFIPMSMVRAMRIKPKPTLWQRLTGS
ncbi:hypothetical protein [Brevibacillus migulae]|uniref:hypothetical protein n=1 Tax=Brevibacillus migulae TaxID=1644114 RepID=UPI00106ECA04|nr:hypothetical protein [Brevibacillus migulae]